jgi:hypothetical protein
MRPTIRITLLFAALAAAALAVAPALYANDQGSSGGGAMNGMMGRGTMGGMMGRTGMMDHCGAMMRGDRAGRRPNDQWRSPRSPDANGKG